MSVQRIAKFRTRLNRRWGLRLMVGLTEGGFKCKHDVLLPKYNTRRLELVFAFQISWVVLSASSPNFVWGQKGIITNTCSHNLFHFYPSSELVSLLSLLDPLTTWWCCCFSSLKRAPTSTFMFTLSTPNNHHSSPNVRIEHTATGTRAAKFNVYFTWQGGWVDPIFGRNPSPTTNQQWQNNKVMGFSVSLAGWLNVVVPCLPNVECRYILYQDEMGCRKAWRCLIHIYRQ